MKLPVFKLESYFQKWEFKAPFQLCNSDAEALSLKELLELADAQGKSHWESLRLGYTEVNGSPPLKDEISKLYSSISPNQVITFSGGEEGIYSTFHSLLSPGDQVIVVTPCYQSHMSIPQALGCQVTSLPLDSKNGWKLDLDQIQSVITSRTKMIVINFPHNPTGATLSREEVNRLIEIARSHHIYIFSDEAYRFSELKTENQMPPLADLYEKAISLGVLSKAFGLAGLRIGWIATQDPNIVQQLSFMKHYLSICGSGPSEVLAVIALRAKDQILKRNHEILENNLKLLDQFFDRYSNVIQWVRPTGGCAGFPKLLLKQSIESFAEELVHEEGVLLLPSCHYDWPGNYFRIGFGRKNMSEGLSRLERFIQRKL